MNITYKYFNKTELRKRGYTFTFVLYPDSKEYDTEFILKAVKEYYNGGSVKDYAYILHDQDGKNHYHVVIKYEKQKTIQTILNDYAMWNYNPNETEFIVHSWKGMLNYLIHNTKDSKDKYQYSEDEVISSCPEVINNLRTSKDAIDIFNDIIDFINNYNGYITMSKVIEYCRHNDDKYLKVLLSKQYNITIYSVVKEHNVI